MESVLTGPAASGNSIEDEKYGLLPEGFSEKYLSVANFAEDSQGGDMEMFDAWSAYLEKCAGTEDIRDIIDEIEDDLVDGDKAASVWPRTQCDSDIADLVPDQEILQRLKAEMAEKGSSASCSKDMEFTLKSLGMTV